MGFSPSPMEIAVIAVIALIVLGPARLPEAARSVGKGLREMKASFQGDEEDENLALADYEYEDEDDADEEDDVDLEADDTDATSGDESEEPKAATEKAGATAQQPASPPSQG